MKNNFSKILLIHVSGRVGDSLLGVPTIAAVCRNFKNAHIDLLVHRNRKDLFENFPGINTLGTISDKRAIWKGWFNSSAYDLTIVFNYYEPLENILNYALRASRKVIAFESQNKIINLKLYKSCKREALQHTVKAYLKLLHPLKIYGANPRIKFYLTENEKNYSLKNLADHSLLNKYLVGFQIASLPSRSYRDWPVSYFVETFKMIKAVKPNAFVIIFGGIEEHKKINQFKRGIGKGNYMDLSGLSLRLTAAMMSKINLYLGVDTGPTHLMSAFEIPMVVLYHCKLPSRYFGPLKHPHCAMIDHPLGSKGSERSSMKDIKPIQAFKEIKRYL